MKKKTIVVIGLLPSQANKLPNIKDIRIRCIESRGSAARIPNGDHCILMIKFIRHLWSDQAVKQFARGRVHYVMGSVSEVTRTICNIAKDARKETKT